MHFKRSREPALHETVAKHFAVMFLFFAVYFLFFLFFLSQTPY